TNAISDGYRSRAVIRRVIAIERIRHESRIQSLKGTPPPARHAAVWTGAALMVDARPRCACTPGRGPPAGRRRAASGIAAGPPRRYGPARATNRVPWRKPDDGPEAERGLASFGRQANRRLRGTDSHSIAAPRGTSLRRVLLRHRIVGGRRIRTSLHLLAAGE